MQAMPMGMAGMPMPVPSTRQPPKRKSKRLDIIDPDTGLAITFNSNSSVGRTSSTSSAATVEDIHMDAGEQKKLQEKKSTSIEELPVTSPAPNMSMADTKQNGAATSVTPPEESLVSKAANKDPKPAAYPAKGLEPTRGTNGVKEAESVGKAAAETSGFKTSEGTASTTRKPTTTTTSTSAKVSSPKRQTQSAKDPAEETFAAKQPESVPSNKKGSSQDVGTPTLQQEALPGKENDDVTNVREKTPASAIGQATAVSVGSPANSGGKSTYSLELMTSFREHYKDLPATTTDSDWPSMEISSEAAVSRGGSRGGRGGAGWERGDKLAGGTGRQGARSSSGGGQWARSQDLPKRTGRAEHGGRGERGTTPDLPLLDGPVKPLTRSANRWIPTKNTSTLEVTKKNVNGIMNKMTREKFERLAGQLTSINMESLEMLQAVIKIIFDKAVGEPHFCDMYADLCVHLETNWKVWSFLKIVQNDDDKTFYWTAMSDSDSEVVGPFDTVSSALDSASSDEFEPVPAPSNMKLSEVRVRHHKFVKVWVHEDPTKPQYYWSGQDLDDLGDDQVLNGPFESHEQASRVALKSCSFRRILLNACQEEFEKDNIYEELEQKFRRDKEEGKITPQMATDYEEKRLIMKLRMLGNIRFIGELYRKGMLQERIMHECIMKLMDVRLNSDGVLTCVHPNDPPDEESIESLAKLLTTMGKDLDKHGQALIVSYHLYDQGRH
uniref:MIF4G domain-containing protein n=1 Tax=Hyaloperonospora arabidopsidis (strain Emoy2) TaxID=559515 RepID=M4BIW5_HYAAE